jgi:hypothetical protein
VEFVVPENRDGARYTVYWCRLHGLPDIPFARIYAGPPRIGFLQWNRDFEIIDFPPEERFQPSEFVTDERTSA